MAIVASCTGVGLACSEHDFAAHQPAQDFMYCERTVGPNSVHD